MLRAIVALGGTAAGLAALLSFKTHVPAVAAAATPNTTSSAAAAPASSGSASKSGGSGKKSGSASKTGNATGGGTGSATTRTVTGKVENTQYGPMQIQLVLAGKKISKVNVLQQTNTGSNSVVIDANALPKLTSETLTAQSARIDAVSGATYTSQGYIASLQSAVDAAGLA
jgi:uncharacterized protein with FMN-binding domain